MKWTFFIMMLLAATPKIFAQVSGTFVTSNNKPAPFATVVLVASTDSSLVLGGITDENGNYLLENVQPGSYILRFSSLGFVTWNSPAFQLTTTLTKKDFGTQIIQENSENLGEITIRGEKPLFEQRADGTVINVESSVLTKGSSALQVLERSPGVYVDQRNSSIALNGKSSVMVMLNGKLIRMPTSQVVAMLNSMSANDIEKIELLTTPPSRYDAEGTGGIINIVMKKRVDLGTTGTFSATAGYGWKEKAGGSINLTHNTGKVNIYGSYSLLHDHLRDGWDALSTQDMPAFGGKQRVDVGSHQNVRSNSHNAAAGIDINFGKTTIGSSITYNGSRISRDMINSGTYTLIESDSLLGMYANIKSKNKWNNVIANVYLEKQIRAGEKLNIDVDYLGYTSQNPTEGYTTFYDRHGNEAFPSGSIFSNRQSGISSTPIHVGVFKIDYNKQLSAKLKLEAGLKGTWTTSSSLSMIRNLVNGEWVSSSRYTNAIDMNETIGAAYSSLYYQANPLLNVVAGVRYEYAHTHADADKEENRINRKLGKFFPSVFISRKLNDRSEIQFSYTKRISRPSFNDLSSYLMYNDPMSVSSGNPALRPTITNNLKLGYTYNGYSFSMLASRDDFPIILYQQKESPARDLVYLAPQNMVFQNNLTFQANLPFTINNWWKMTYSVTGGLRQFKLDHTKEKLQKTYFAYNMNGNQVFTLPRNFTFEISGWYNSLGYEGSKRIDAFGMLNAGIKKEFKNNGGTIQLAVTDLLKSMRVSGYFGELTEEAFSLKAHFIYKAESANNRIVKLTYIKSFGNLKVKEQNQRGPVSKDERDRIRKN